MRKQQATSALPLACPDRSPARAIPIIPMAARPFILFPPESSDAAIWRIGMVADSGPLVVEISVPAQASAPESAACVAAALSRHGYDRGGVILAVPSAWCMAATISAADLPRHDRKAMLFRLEEKLPVPAEGVVADFIPLGPEGGSERMLGVCVQIDLLRPLVEALESHHVTVQSIAPAVLLAAQQVQDQAHVGPQLLICGEGGHVNLLALNDGLPAAWALLPARAEDVRRELEVLSTEFETAPRMRAIDIDSDLLAAIGIGGGGDEKTFETGAATGTLCNIAIDAADSVLSGRRPPWIEFRQGPLAAADRLRRHRRPLNAFLAAAACLALAFTVATGLRAYRYDRKARSTQAQMVSEFARAFPGWATPANVKSMIESEHRKAEARTPASLPSESHGSALRVLQSVLGGLPADLRVSVERMTFTDTGFELDGRLTSYEDLDRLAAGARKAGLEVSQPQARKDASGIWSFTLRGAQPGRPPARTPLARQG
jgi:GspL periplasmic domain